MESTVKELVATYFEMGLLYRDIVRILDKSHEVHISERHLKRILRGLNLRRRGGYSSVHEVVQFLMTEIRGSGMLHGYRIMHARCIQNNTRVKKEDVRLILREIDPEGVEARIGRRLRRRSYSASGPNFIWHFDGYDKLKPFGLCISGCIDGFSRKIVWMNVYRTNNNPKVIGGYFLEAVKLVGGCPKLVRGDFGTENTLVRDFQTFLRRNCTDNAAGRCYLDGASTCNQRIESWWAFLRKECSQFWIDLLRSLVDSGHFQGSSLDKSIMQFCCTSPLQACTKFPFQYSVKLLLKNENTKLSYLFIYKAMKQSEVICITLYVLNESLFSHHFVALTSNMACIYNPFV
jgi:hypothetical protein